MQDPDFIGLTFKLIEQIRRKLDRAASIVKAAESCAESGNAEHAIQILIDYEGLAHEARDLFRAVLAIKRNFVIEEN